VPVRGIIAVINDLYHGRRYYCRPSGLSITIHHPHRAGPGRLVDAQDHRGLAGFPDGISTTIQKISTTVHRQHLDEV
jgi:hypothetical protein